VNLAYLLGRSYVGMRAEDTLRAARFLGEGRRRVHLVAVGEAGPPALHAAALEPELFASVKLVGSLRSWVDVVRTATPSNGLAGVVHGALKVYDLPDLVRTLGGKASVVEPVDGEGKR
jgi:hypothetical protein